MLCALAALELQAAAQVRTQQKVSALAGGFAGSLAEFDRFGISLGSLGDFDGDGIRDIVVGAHHDNGGGLDRGAVWLLLMNADASVREELKIGDQVGGFSGVLADRDRFGISAVGIGDLDQDGCIDLAVGAYRDDDAGMDSGTVWILFMEPDGTVREHTKINGLGPVLAGQLGPNHLFGRSLAPLGDLDGDGALDLLVGASRAPDGGFQRGKAWVLFLRPDGSVKAAQAIGQGQGGFQGQISDDDRFGASVANLGDLDGDGVCEVAIGAYRDDTGGLGVNADRGAVWILFLRRDGSVASHQKLAQGVGELQLLLQDGDGFGISLCNAGDLNRDGLCDLIVGAEADDDGGLDRGALYRVTLRADGTARGFDKISATQGNFSGELDDLDCFGVSVLVPGDWDGDGVRELVVGTSRDDDGATNAGAIWSLFQDGSAALPPVAGFSAPKRVGQGPLVVRFQDQSLGEIDDWHWDFGDGNSSSHRQPVHNYQGPGSYSVRLTVSGPGGVQTLKLPSYVVVLPRKISQLP